MSAASMTKSMIAMEKGFFAYDFSLSLKETRLMETIFETSISG